MPARPLAAAIATYTSSAARTAADAAPLARPAEAAGKAPAPPSAVPGTQLQLRFIGPLPTLGAALASAARGDLIATVLARTPAGPTIIDTAVGHMSVTLPPMAEVSEGTQIAFEILAVHARAAATPAAMTTAATVASQRTLPTLGHEWPSLRAVLETLTVLDPSLARQVSDVALAHPASPRFLAQLLSFLAAPTHDSQSLLGQTAAASLERGGHGELITRLNADLREMARLNATPSDWRVFFVPILDMSEVRQLRIYGRRRKAERERGRDPGNRFVVEIEFEHVGPLQLDGLIQKPRIDLILRSHAELSPAMQSGITEVFDRTCAAAGLAGQMFFQAMTTFPVSPFEEITRTLRPGLSV